MKETICTIAGVVGSAIAGLFGGWDTSLVAAAVHGHRLYWTIVNKVDRRREKNQKSSSN